MKHLFFSLCMSAALPAMASVQTSATCIDYNKPQDIQPGHYWDGKIHLVPMFELGGKIFKGYVAVYIPKGSPFLDKGIQIGDVITEVDGRALTPPAPGNKGNQALAHLLNFKSITLERCQRLSLKP